MFFKKVLFIHLTKQHETSQKRLYSNNCLNIDIAEKSSRLTLQMCAQNLKRNI